MDVGIRELKAHLSEYVERVANGEMVRVTDRGEPKALLMPLPRTHNVERGIREGWIRPGRTGARRTAWNPQAPEPGAPTSEEVFDEDRGD